MLPLVSSASRLIPLCLALILSAGCGEAATTGTAGLVEQACRTTPEGYTDCQPSGPLPPGATPPPPATAVVASEQALAGVPLGTPAEEAASQLAAKLGPPQVEEHSCQRLDRRESLDVPLRGERLTWKSIYAYTTTLPSGEHLLTGWSVMTPRQEPWPYDVQLPYDLSLEAPVQEVLEALPRAVRGAA